MIGCSIATTAIGGVLVIVISVLGYVFVPDFIPEYVSGELVLIEDTIQFERFTNIPFPVNFTITLFNITNPEEVKSGGVPVVTEVGPYVYKIYQRRVIEEISDDTISFRMLQNYEFDAEQSYPNTKDDMITVVNAIYHIVLQTAQSRTSGLMGLLNQGLASAFGEFNSPITTVRVQDIMFDGIRLCENPGLIGGVLCSLLRDEAVLSPNLEINEDNSVSFSLLGYKNNKSSALYKVSRGLESWRTLGQIQEYNGLPFLPYWVDDPCNMLNGSDTILFPPFLDKYDILYAFNSDICRSVGLRFEKDDVYEGVPVSRFVLNDWFLDNNEGCYCLNMTEGLNAADGCLLKGALEMYSCVGAFTVMSYPHFLFADPQYLNGVIGMTPDINKHRIFLDLDMNTGTVIRGAKRAQINVFMRPITGVPETLDLKTTLTPVFWLEESSNLPKDLVNELRNRMLFPLNLISILIPVFIALSAVVFVIGAIFTYRGTRKSKTDDSSKSI